MAKLKHQPGGLQGLPDGCPLFFYAPATYLNAALG